MSSPRRFYIHGDQSEDNPRLYYCAHADQFRPFGHFMYESESSRMAQYVHDQGVWVELSQLPEWRRPAAPENIVNPPDLTCESARWLAEFEHCGRSAQNWLQALPAPTGPLDEPLELPPYNLHFPPYSRLEALELKLRRLIRELGVEHLEALKARLRDADEQGRY